MITARAAVVDGVGAEFSLDEVAVGPPGPGQVAIAVGAVGICHADLAVRDGTFPVAIPLPAVLGHEGAGTITAVGPGVRDLVPGDRVVLTYASCGNCRPCERGRPTLCEQMVSLNCVGPAGDDRLQVSYRGEAINAGFLGQSSFRSHVVTYQRNAVKVGTDLGFASLAPLGCSVQTGAAAVLRVLQPAINSSLAVFGLGAVGFSALLAARFSPVRQVIAVDINPDRLALASELGASATINSADTDPVQGIRELTAGGVDAAIECSGNTAALRQAIAAGATGSTVVVVGVPPSRQVAGLDVADLVDGSKRILGSIQDTQPRDIVPFLAGVIADGRFPLQRIITTFDFSEINTAAAAMSEGRIIKPVLTFE